MSKKNKHEKAKIMFQAKQIQCVQCRSRAVRSIGKDHYFCADCCTEFRISGDEVTLYSISMDGGVLKIS